MYIRAAKTLVFIREDSELIGYNFLTKSTFQCSHDLLSFLAMADDWTSPNRLCRLCPLIAADDLDAQIQDLIAVDAVIAQGSEADCVEQDFLENWKWGLPAALFHQTVQDRPYMSLDEATKLQRERLSQDSVPELFQRAQASDDTAIRLSRDSHTTGLLALMRRRRTVRRTGAETITLAALSDCLFAGFGITGLSANDAGVTLPLGMTPSGGARNPFEAYVVAKAVDGLAQGIYHYSARDHALSRVETNEFPALSDLAGGQDWADDMPCMVLLIGHLDRTMWKYHDANAYRVVLIEAGHIGQNVMLAATEHGLSACPTAALDHSLVRRTLRLGDTIARPPIYALTLAVPGQADEVIPLPASESDPVYQHDTTTH